VDTVANLTVEAGNFSPQTRTAADSVKTRAITDFYRTMHYDAVALSSREVAFGLDFWKTLAKEGLPVVAANVFKDKRRKKPVFEPYVIKRDHDENLAVVGLVSESAWKSRRDTALGFTWKSPFEMGKVLRKAAKKSDCLAVIGEFTMQEAESLARAFPEVNAVISSGIKADQVVRAGKTLVVGASTRGNVANYLEFKPVVLDTAGAYVSKAQTLDPTVPEDSLVTRLLGHMKEQIQAVQAKPAGR
jgi:2',3'-cyclic-nucleotide 2'-phosphodiesterase (5'-nucleotidase family)